MGLLHIPNELIIRIFTYAEVADLVRLCLTHRHIKDIAEPFLYKRFSYRIPATSDSLRHPARSSLIQFLRSLILRPVLGGHVRSLDVQIGVISANGDDRKQESGVGIEMSDRVFQDRVSGWGETLAWHPYLPDLLALLLTKVPKIDHLSLRVTPGQVIDVGSQLDRLTHSALCTNLPLSTLTSLDVTGVDAWDGTSLDEISFKALPSVRRLFMQRCLHTALSNQLQLAYSTSCLSEIVLYQCAFDGSALCKLLGMCNNLKVFGYQSWDPLEVDENETFHFRGGVLFSALRKHQTSLKLLLLDFEQVQGYEFPDQLDSDLHAMQRIEGLAVSQNMLLNPNSVQFLPSNLQRFWITHADHIALDSNLAAIQELQEQGQLASLKDVHITSGNEEALTEVYTLGEIYPDLPIHVDIKQDDEKPRSGLYGLGTMDEYLTYWSTIVHYFEWDF
jgi:hypothetical protein